MAHRWTVSLAKEGRTHARQLRRQPRAHRGPRRRSPRRLSAGRAPLSIERARLRAPARCSEGGERRAQAPEPFAPREASAAAAHPPGRAGRAPAAGLAGSRQVAATQIGPTTRPPGRVVARHAAAPAALVGGRVVHWDVPYCPLCNGRSDSRYGSPPLIGRPASLRCPGDRTAD
jgi:hypothetical protein